jgi:hypothetical protein
MEELLQLDLSSRPSQTGYQALTEPTPPARAQPSLLDDGVPTDSVPAWSSPFAAWDNLVAVSPTKTVRSLPPPRTCGCCSCHARANTSQANHSCGTDVCSNVRRRAG